MIGFFVVMSFPSHLVTGLVTGPSGVRRRSHRGVEGKEGDEGERRPEEA